MKKITTWITVIAFIIFAIDWGIVGLKLLSGDYDITTGAYIGAACLVVIFACAICKAFNRKCPYCGKLLCSNGKYCPHCGKEINQ